jgi:formylglycine-generating enzyme required for sulfatase activity
MAVTLSLLRIVGKTLLNAVGGGFVGDLVCEVLPEVAEKSWKDWSKEKTEPQRRAEVEQLAQAPDEEMRRWVQETLDEVAPGQSTEVRGQLAGYLMQLPACVRQNMRRPTDPTGSTVPAGLALRKASDLLSLLPKRPPRFKPGSRPLPGVDLELVEMLGIGGFGEVWKARNPHRPRAQPVALKFCLDEAAAATLRNEVDVLDRIMSAGTHPGIVALRQTYLSAEPPCLEFECVEGGDLAGLIQEWHSSGEQPTPDQAARVVRHLAEAVAFAHRQQPTIVHRDLKPANVLVKRDAEGKLHYQISDFGLGALAHPDLKGTQRSGSTAPTGYTLLYASPEQVKGEPASPTDDVYALGVVWYQLLTGDLESGAPTGLGWVKELQQHGMSQEQLQLLADCFASHAADRPASAEALLERLDATLEGKRPAPRKKGRLVPVLLTVMILSISVVALLGYNVWDWGKDETNGGPASGDWRSAREFTNSVGMKLVRIPMGTFEMGAPESETGREADETPRHQVTITADFFLGTCEITQSQYEQVMGAHDFAFSKRGRKAAAVTSMDTSNFPAENVSREQAEEFCRKLSQVPEEREHRRIYRLPTEAEWEYACRAGSTTAFHHGKKLDVQQANFDSRQPYGEAETVEPADRPKPVGSYPANAFGLFDMHGNVREWVADGYEDRYDRAALKDPLVAPADRRAVMRGGCWFDAGKECRSAARKDADPNRGYAYTGFRVALSIDPGK